MSRRALFWNSVSGTALYAASVIVSFVMSPVMVKYLGDGGYGFWELLLGLVGYLGILDMGVAPAVMRFVALAHASGDRERMRGVVNAGFATFLVAGLFGAGVIGVISLRPEWAFAKIPVDLADARLAIVLAAMIFLLTFTRATFSASLMGLQYHRIVNTTRIVTSVAQAASIYMLLPHYPGHALVVVAGVCAAVTLFESLFFAVLLMTMVGHGYAPWTARWREGRDLFGFGAKSAGLMASSSLVKQGILFVLAHVIGVEAVTFYVFAGRLVEYGQQLAMAIGFPMAPYLTAAFGGGGIDAARQAWLSTTRVMQFIQAGIAMGIFWLGLPFLARWLGPDYALKGAGVFYFLCGAALCTVVGANANRMLVSLNQHGRAAIAALVLGALCLGGAIPLTMSFGITGAAAAAFVFMVGLNLVELTLVCRALGVEQLPLLWSTVRRNLPPVVAGSLCMAAAAYVWPAASYGRIAVHGVIGAVPYLVVSWFTALSADERGRLMTGIRART